MKGERLQLIDKLIEELKANDKDFDRYFDEEGLLIKSAPEEPRKAIDELARMGGDAVEPLLELLKDKETWSIGYAIEVLGEIRDGRAIKPLIELLGEGFDIDEISEALLKIGPPVLEPILEYLKAPKERLPLRYSLLDQTSQRTPLSHQPY